MKKSTREKSVKILAIIIVFVFLFTSVVEFLVR